MSRERIDIYNNGFVYYELAGILKVTQKACFFNNSQPYVVEQAFNACRNHRIQCPSSRDFST
jgi:hypothetical protein